jgi:RND family efflux transporter MFP subunit
LEQAAEKQFELAKLQLSYTKLTAPVNGAIAAIDAEINENVGAGQPIITLTSGADLEVKIAVPEILISKIIEGSRVRVAFDAIPGKEYNGIIHEVGVATTGMGTTFPVTVRLSAADDAVRPGMAASVACRFESSDDRERYLIPSHAVMEDRSERFVYLVEPISGEDGFGTIQRRSVTVGEFIDENLEVFSGLTDGDLVVTAGMSRIATGQKVRM